MIFRIATTMGVIASGCWLGPEVGPRVEMPVYTADAGQTDTDGGDLPGASFQQVLTEVLVPTCAQSFCHKLNPPPAAPMTLEESTAYSQLVNVPASQEPTLMRVKPGDPANSYLVIKLRAMSSNTWGTTQMPLNKPALEEEQVRVIESWIARGAPND
jgi:hypothetical protein